MNVVVSAVLVLVLSLSVVGMVMQYGIPLIQEQKQEMDFEQGKNIINYISFSVSDLMAEPINSSRILELTLRKGKIEFLDNKISFYLGYQEYNKEFSKIKFTEMDIPVGDIRIRITKKLKDEIGVELVG